MSYWDDLAQQIEAFEQRRELQRETHLGQVKRRADHYKRGLPGRQPRAFRRNVQRRFRLYPWAAVDLDEIAHVRMMEPGEIVSAIIEPVTELWKKHIHDECLYIKRVPLPTEADAVLGASSHTPISVAVGLADSYIMRMLGVSVIKLLRDGIDAGQIHALVDDISRSVNE